jgi:hypothetical protein
MFGELLPANSRGVMQCRPMLALHQKLSNQFHWSSSGSVGFLLSFRKKAAFFFEVRV